jgi:hypothetical protein
MQFRGIGHSALGVEAVKAANIEADVKWPLKLFKVRYIAHKEPGPQFITGNASLGLGNSDWREVNTSCIKALLRHVSSESSHSTAEFQ